MEDLNKLISDYNLTKKALDIMNKNAVLLGKEIKNRLKKMDLVEYDTDELTATITEISKDVLDEESLLPVLKEMFPDEEDLIIKIEKINLDKLEDMCYNRIIPADVVNQFIIHKEPTVRLNIRQRKEKSDGKDNNNPGKPQNHSED